MFKCRNCPYDCFADKSKTNSLCLSRKIIHRSHGRDLFGKLTVKDSYVIEYTQVAGVDKITNEKDGTIDATGVDVTEFLITILARNGKSVSVFVTK
jgi:hypothetical protein